MILRVRRVPVLEAAGAESAESAESAVGAVSAVSVVRVVVAFLAIGAALSSCGAGSANESPAARVAVLAEECSDRTGGEHEIAVEEAFPAEGDARDWVIVDVRTPEEIEISRLPGSLDRDAFERVRHESEGRPILAYCTAGCRSGRFVERLVAEGHDARNLHGGMLAWALAGRSIVDGNDAPTMRVHVVGDRWAVLPEPYEMITNGGAR